MEVNKKNMKLESSSKRIMARNVTMLVSTGG